jgi:hypothetical protein
MDAFGGLALQNLAAFITDLSQNFGRPFQRR